jgi:hypothetical protein
MCLITRQMQPLIAENDMIVYKILRVNLQSPYWYFRYEQNKVYKTEILDAPSNKCTVFDNREFEFLKKEKIDWANEEWIKENKETIRCISAGFHAATTPGRLNNTVWELTEILFKCTIPKGSEYFEDGDELIVSNQIIINEEYVENN